MRLRKGSVSYGLGADFSLPHCLVGDKGIGKQLGTISSRHKRSAGRNLVVNRLGTELRQSVQEVPLSAVFFSPFQLFCLKYDMRKTVSTV